METTAYRPSKSLFARPPRTPDVGNGTTDADAMSVHLASSRLGLAARTEPSRREPIQLCLSDPDGTPDPHEFARRGEPARKGRITQILASLLAASAIAVLVAVFQADIGRLFTGKSSAGSMIRQAMMASHSSVAQPIPPKDPARVSNPMRLASADSAETVVPSREAIATAYQNALQAQAPTQAAPSAPAKTLGSDTLAGLMTRAKGLIEIGDIAAARLLLERAANAQDAVAAFMLAQTYDPAVLGTSDTRSIIADPAAARDWYRKAAQLGSVEARQRLAQLQD